MLAYQNFYKRKEVYKMSKMLNKYLKLKNNNNDIVYLFKSGIFFIALQEDAKLLSEKLNLKITHLNEEVVKCGFPVSSEKHYFELLTLKDITFEVIDNLRNEPLNHANFLQDEKINCILQKITDINFDEITFRQAYDILLDTSTEIKKCINKGGNNGKYKQ